MNETEFCRSELLLGKDALDKLSKAKVAVFGLGGVGSYVVEALARTGICNFILIDKDTVSISNINRQLIATHDTIGKLKVDVAKERILSINPNANVQTFAEFFMPGNSAILDNSIDYIIDAIDTVTAKIELVMQAKKLNIPIISSMGTGNKLDPTKFEVTDIYKTSVCPLAKVMRKELKARNIDKLKVLYSKEEPIKTNIIGENGKSTPRKYSFCTFCCRSYYCKRSNLRLNLKEETSIFVPSFISLNIYLSLFSFFKYPCT